MNLKLIKQCATFSKEIYDETTFADNYKTIIMVINNVAFSLINKDDKLFIVVRGSDNKSNWFFDFSILKTFDNDLKIYLHSGYKKIADNILNYLEKVLINRIFLQYEIIITGHSLGGALAQILGFKLNSLGLNVKNIITFGSPKITNFYGAKLLSSNNIVKRKGLIRVINDNDIVNLLPPNTFLSWFRGFYRHFGTELILLDDEEVSINSDIKVLRKNKSLFKNIDFESLKEHKISNYVEKLNKIKYINNVKHTFGG